MNAQQYLSELDMRAGRRRQLILNSPSEYVHSGRTYYISNSGDDRNDGTTPVSAWSSLDRVNSFAFSEGDAVLFQRGGLWRGQLQCRGGVVYSAYGSGEKPKIYGSAENYARSKWDETCVPGVYVLSQPIKEDCGLIVFDGGKAHSNKKIDGVASFDGDIRSLGNDLDMYHSVVDRRIYLRSDSGNPSERFGDIETAVHRHAVTVTGDNVTIDNLCIMYTGSHGIGTADRNGLTVKNCILGWIGGSIQSINSATRYGNAVEIYVSCRDFTVSNCYIYEVYDAAVTHQFKNANQSVVTMENVTYRGNLIEKCTYSIEYFLGQDDAPGQIMRNILIEDNICRLAGYGWGRQRPDRETPAHIKGWNHKNPSDGFFIRGNVFDRSTHMMIHCGSDDENSLPVFENNAFIQSADGSFGRYGKNPPDMKAYSTAVKEGFFDSEMYIL